MRNLRFLLCAFLIAAYLVVPGTTGAQSGNLLQNPGFEEPYVTINGDTTLSVASNWLPWFLSPGASSAINAQPEYKPASAERVRSGSSAQSLSTFFATHTAGVYQRVPVAPNTDLRFSVYVYVWSSASFENPDVSDDPNTVLLRVGIDPTGGTDASSANVVWSRDEEFYDEYRELSVTATSQGNAVTVFVRSAPQGFVGTSNVYLDDAALAPLGTVLPTATTAPTALPINTPTPTQEGIVTPVPTSVLPTAIIPTATSTLPDGFGSTVIYTVVAGDTLSSIAQRYESTVDAIAEYNGLTNVALINIGQTLVVPVPAPPIVIPPTFTPAPTLAGEGIGGAITTTIGTYTVRYGDTMYAIATSFYSTVETLAYLNNIINPALIYPGQVLQVSGETTTTPTLATPTPVPVTPAVPVRHVVQTGENLFRIGLMYNVRADVLAYTNGIWNSNLIYPGQVLVIP